MKLIIQRNLMNQDSLAKITNAAIAHNLPYAFVDIIPFSREITSDEPLVGTDYLPYGSTTLTIETHKLGWKGQYFNPETFRMDVWNVNRDDMLNDGPITTIADAIEFLRTQEPGSLWFTRPVEDLKTYSGQVIEAQECLGWFIDATSLPEDSGSYFLARPTPIIIAPPQTIQLEWRWFIVGGKVIDGSVYRRLGHLHTRHEDDSAVIAEAQELADKWLPSPCCCMDTCLVDGELKVLEFNTQNSSGFYDNDVEKVIVELYRWTKENM